MGIRQETRLTKSPPFNFLLKKPPQFVPAIGVHNFWWRGQYFRLHRKRESIFDDSGGNSTFKDKENLIISCLWRSPSK